MEWKRTQKNERKNVDRKKKREDDQRKKRNNRKKMKIASEKGNDMKDGD